MKFPFSTFQLNLNFQTRRSDLSFKIRKILDYLNFKPVLKRTFYVVLLGVSLWLSNILTANAATNSHFIWLEPKYIQSFLTAVDQYTPLINEKESELIALAAGENQDYLTKPSLGEEIKQEYRYTVQKGDTISTIAKKFNINVASIQEVNHLSALEMDKIKPGSSLIIPPYNIKNSLAWLTEINQEKARQAEEARKKALEKARLARLKQSRRIVAFRDQSSTRIKTSAHYAGTAKRGFIIPIHHKGISRGITRYHTGIDFRADIGTPVVAAQKGKVVELTHSWGRGWGNSVVLDHGSGLKTRYAHLSKISVKLNQVVSQGQIIGYSGNTGWSTGPHLHYEARQNGRVVNPLNL